MDSHQHFDADIDTRRRDFEGSANGDNIWRLNQCELRYLRLMEAKMILFRLQLIAIANRSLIANLPEVTQPYGSFVAGQFFTWNGHTYQIMDVAHGAMAQPDGPLLMETSLLLK